MPKNPRVGVNRQFQANMPKYINRTISKPANPITPKYKDKTEITISTLWVAAITLPNPTWLTSAILKIISMPRIIGFRRNSVRWWKPHADYNEKVEIKTNIEFRYRGRLFSENGSRNISAMDRDTWSKFGTWITVDFLRCKALPNRKPGVDLRIDSRHIRKSIWRYNSVGDHRVWHTIWLANAE